MTQASTTGTSATSTDTFRWGIIGTGAIAKAFAFGVKGSQRGRVVAVASRTQAKADAFADEHEIPTRHGSYDDLLADPDVQAVYISTPHPMHAEWAVKAADAGKHVLCEKPSALNHAELQAMVEAAREAGVLLMEAFMYRCHPQTAKLVELVRDKAIGEVRTMWGCFSFNAGFNPESRLFSAELGGGGIMDVGCYPVSMSRLVAGAALGRPFADPHTVRGIGHLVETGVDGWAHALLQFDGDICATISTGVQVTQDNTFRIFGSDGSITVPNPWVAGRGAPTPGQIIVHRKGQDAQTIDIETERTSFGIEADVFAEAVQRGEDTPAHPAMSVEDSLGNLATLDRWRDAVKVVYPQEMAEGSRPIRQPLKARPDHNMKYGQVPHVARPVAKLIMGCDNKDSMRDAAPVWDDYIERGGNTFDTAHCYGRHRQVIMGQWLRSRGIRDQVNLICKGAHTPHCTPEGLTRQLHESLEDFGMDFVDIYVMHRDNLEVPVGEFVDVLNEHIDAGRIGAIGGSNWTLERVQAANAYAKEQGKRGLDFVNNNLSLAVMNDPVWAGCIHVHTDAWLSFFEQTQTANLSWSSQGRGFFSSRDATGMPGRSWDDADNRKRRERAFELAQQKGCTAMNIAAAWVLCQPFPSFALIGPRLIHETATCMPSLDVELTPQELAYLDLKTDAPT